MRDAHSNLFSYAFLYILVLVSFYTINIFSHSLDITVHFQFNGSWTSDQSYPVRSLVPVLSRGNVETVPSNMNSNALIACFLRKLETLVMDKQNKTEGVYSARYGGKHYWSLEFKDPEHLNIDWNNRRMKRLLETTLTEFETCRVPISNSNQHGYIQRTEEET